MIAQRGEMARRRNNKGLSRAQERRLLVDLRRDAKTVLALMAAIDVACSELRREMVWSILFGLSYERIQGEQGYVPINRADFYGCRRKTLAIYAQIIRGEESQ